MWLIGAAWLLPYAFAWRLGDLRAHTVPFVISFAVAFALYGVACIWVLRHATPEQPAGAQDIRAPWGSARRPASWLIAVLAQVVLVFTRPTLSDDMYRYVWDGRVQAHGVSPYLYPPSAPALAGLRDQMIWPLINRKDAVTVYPPAAEAVFALLWRLFPDRVRAFQVAMALGGVTAGILLLGLLRALGQNPERALIYLWSPLLAFETAHSAHVDALVLPLLVGAWWARVRERDGLTGALLGLATALKLYPVLVFPALWRPGHRQGRWRMPAGFLLALAACYAPYVAGSGAKVLGYLPQYVGERFNMGLAGLLALAMEGPGFHAASIVPTNKTLAELTALVLAVLALWMILRPALDAPAALRRSVWLLGAYVLLTPALYPWYVLWVLPLVALFLQPGGLGGIRWDAWSGWWSFTGLVGLSYLFFIRWVPVPAALWIEFVPIWALLALDAARRVAGLRYHAARSLV